MNTIKNYIRNYSQVCHICEKNLYHTLCHEMQLIAIARIGLSVVYILCHSDFRVSTSIPNKRNGQIVHGIITVFRCYVSLHVSRGEEMIKMVDIDRGMGGEHEGKKEVQRSSVIWPPSSVNPLVFPANSEQPQLTYHVRRQACFPSDCITRLSFHQPRPVSDSLTFPCRSILPSTPLVVTDNSLNIVTPAHTSRPVCSPPSAQEP